MILGTFKDRSASSTGSGSSTQTRLHALSVDTDSEDDESHTGAQGEQLAGWAYVGSHNFTPSAWGTLSGTAARSVLNVSVFLSSPSDYPAVRGHTTVLQARLPASTGEGSGSLETIRLLSFWLGDCNLHG